MQSTEKRIFFAHQSVGGNIIQGIEDIIAQNHIRDIQIQTKPSLFSGLAIYHKKIGQNADPLSKLTDFSEQLLSLPQQMDIACLKFCYVDIKHDTKIEPLFEQYQATMRTIQQAQPTLRILHVTTPLRKEPSELSYRLRKCLGQVSNKLLDNQKRNHYNQLMRHHYANEDIFDLAKLESTLPSGKACYTKLKGEKIFQLAPCYTEDGGHLNLLGSQYIADHFIKKLRAI